MCERAKIMRTAKKPPQAGISPQDWRYNFLHDTLQLLQL